MCANCGFPLAPGHWTEAGFGDFPHERVRARFRRIEILKTILPAFGLTAHDSIQTPGIILGIFTGNHAIVPDLAELWRTAEVLVGAPIDPLDARLLEAAAPSPAGRG